MVMAVLIPFDVRSLGGIWRVGVGKADTLLVWGGIVVPVVL